MTVTVIAHAELSDVFWEKMIMNYGIESGSAIMGLVGFAVWTCATAAVLLSMDVLECFLHALRLHWVRSCFGGRRCSSLCPCSVFGVRVSGVAQQSCVLYVLCSVRSALCSTELFLLQCLAFVGRIPEQVLPS